MCFIPLPYQPENNRLGGLGPDGRDYLSMIALSRLFLDNIKHLKAYWVMSGIKPAQMALWAGADDFDGTVIEERIGHAAGAKAPKGMTVSELRQTIAAAGFEPVERDTLFRPLAARFKPKGGSGLMASRS
jgi:aminodeoxyfutalosine synthase